MKLSIIIPVRNEKFLIKKIVDQLQSKLKILSYEIIFIDDFSADNTAEVIKELIKTRPQIKIYKNNRKGFYIHIKLEGIGKTIEELEKAENIDQMLIRYLTKKVM